MDNARSFRVTSRDVHSQKFDDEVLIVETKSGLYFSLRGAAVDIWALIESSATPAAMKAALCARYAGDAETIGSAVDRCLIGLLREQLIREIPSPATAHPDLNSDTFTSKQPFVDPTIERFTDMQNLLLLDPIHEVSEEGWPHAVAGDKA